MKISCTLFAVVFSLFCSLSPKLHAGEIVSQIKYTSTPIDPAYAITNQLLELTGNLFERLLRSDANGNLHSACADTWSVSDDGKTYTFILKSDIFWSDGEAVVAEDFVTAFRRILDPTVNAGERPFYLVEIIKNAMEIREGNLPLESLGVTALDNKTVEIVLQNPASYFPSLISHPAYSPVPTHSVKKHGNDWSNQDPYISNGIYQLSKKDNKSIELVPNPFNKDAGLLTHDKLTLKMYEDTSEIVSDLFAGKLDIAVNLPDTIMLPLLENNDLRNKFVPIESTTFAYISAAAPPLDSKEVRRALAMSLDYSAIVTGFGLEDPDGVVKIYPDKLAPININAIKPSWEKQTLEERQTEAKRLLLEAGYNDKNRLSLSLSSQSDVIGKTLVNALKSMWHAIGIDVKENFSDKDTLVKSLISNKYDIMIMHWYADYPDASSFYGDFTSTSGATAWSNDAYDEAYRNLLATSGDAARSEYYATLTKIFFEDVPAIPLLHPHYKLTLSNKVDVTGTVISNLRGRDYVLLSD